MLLITHRSHLDALPESPLKTHMTTRFDQLSEDTDVPPNLVLVETDDDITGPDYAFIGNRGVTVGSIRRTRTWTPRVCAFV